MKFIVVGHPRSGTGYMAELFKAFGYDVGHEKVGLHGISCWAWATHDDEPPWAPGPRPAERPEHFIHVVRHPLKVIASSSLTEQKDTKGRKYRDTYLMNDPSVEISQNHLLWTTKSWIGWNALIRAQGPDVTICVENAPNELSQYLDQKMPRNKLPKRTVNSVPHRDIPWEEFEAQIPGKIRVRLREEAAHYGYEW